MTSTQPGEGTEPPEVAPLDVDGVGAVTVGTIAWAIVFVVLFLLRDRLAESDSQWWIAVAGAGVVLGLLGLVYVTRRARVYRRAQGASDD
ncbi:MAG: DUF2530 domain-containing protein [Actinobacteria bacterium]|nr:DUF2530 domain-containing protein [Actinomycetota bacterium]